MIERDFILQESHLKRVLIINSEDLFSAGLAAFIRSEDGFEVIDKNIINKSALVGAMEEFRPGVLIISERLLVTYLSAIFGCLRDSTALRVIVFNEQENLLQIYEKEEVVVEGASDLIAAIRRNSSRSC